MGHSLQGIQCFPVIFQIFSVSRHAIIGICLTKTAMITEILKNRLEKELVPESLDIEMEGNRLSLVIVSTCFAGLNRVKRQQLVYGVLDHYITSGEIHAVTMKTHAPDEINS